MDPWTASLCALLLIGVLAWLYAWSNILTYDPHRPIVPEPWNIGGEEE